MEKRFIMITITPDAKFDLLQLEEALDKAVDWIQFFPNCWLVFTGVSSKSWFKRVQRVIGDRRRIFVCDVEIAERGGYMPRVFWDFLAKYPSSPQ